jgi:hypothetical protein
VYNVSSRVLRGRGILELVGLHSWIGPFSVSLSRVVAFKILNVAGLYGRKEVLVVVLHSRQFISDFIDITKWKSSLPLSHFVKNICLCLKLSLKEF